MRRYKPLLTRAPKRYKPLLARDQAYDTLLLPAAGALTWTAPNHIIVEYRTNDLAAYAIIETPDTLLPLFVRDNGTRYRLSSANPEPDCYSIPYTGQVLGPTAVYEFWSAGDAATVDLPDYTLTISPRTQLCCGESSGDTHQALLYLPYCNAFPVCFPICAST